MATTKILKWMESKWIKKETKDLKLIGNGTYGIVHSFFQERTKLEKALKVIDYETVEKEHLRQGIDIDKDSWFNETRLEIENLRALDKCEFILRLEDYHLDYDYNCIYLVTELAKTNLLRFIDDSNYDLTATEIKKIINCVLEGLSFAHANQIFHRDIKPENVLVTKSGSYLLCDWGVGQRKELWGTQPLNTNVQGTFAYFSPEIMQVKKQSDKLNLEKVNAYSAGLLFLVCCGLPEGMLLTIDKFSENEHNIKLSKFLEVYVRPKVPEFEALITELTQFDAKGRFSVHQALKWYEAKYSDIKPSLKPNPDPKPNPNDYVN